MGERLYKASYHLFPSGLSSQASSQTNIYEDIADVAWQSPGPGPGPGSDTNSWYLCLTEGRRNHLKSIRFVDWDYDEKPEAAAGQKTWRSQLRKSFSTTCTSILEMFKSIF